MKIITARGPWRITWLDDGEVLVECWQKLEGDYQYAYYPFRAKLPEGPFYLALDMEDESQ